MKQTILILGANGQVGSEFFAFHSVYQNDFDFIFFTKQQFDISSPHTLETFFAQQKITYCINCIAYTKVDKAEEEKDENWNSNAVGVGIIAAICKSYGVKMIHLSTDYVFGGTATQPYVESSLTDPQNEYGRAKLEGEKLCLLNNPQSIVFRTSWVYSSFGNNFVKTMLRLMPEKETLQIVNDQLGSPTYARDIAHMVLQIIQTQEIERAWQNIFHFTNDGVISWHDFATAIKTKKNFTTQIQGIASKDYKTLAKRPAYSVLSKEKFQQTFSIPLQSWESSLDACLQLL